MRLPKALGLVSALALAVAAASAVADGRDFDDVHHVRTATPIKHLVVIFQENVSFDHYFGTYPKALNLSGETPFTASRHTPKVPFSIRQRASSMAWRIFASVCFNFS